MWIPVDILLTINIGIYKLYYIYTQKEMVMNRRKKDI